MSVVSLSDVKSAGNFKDTDDDEQLQKRIDSAESMIARAIGPLAVTSVSEVVPGCSRHLTVNKFPFHALTSVADYTGATLDTSLLWVDAGIIRYKQPYTTLFWSPTYTVTYDIGYDTLPAQVADAVIELTRHLWIPRRNQTRGNPSDQTPLPYALPNRVQELLTPYIPLAGA